MHRNINARFLQFIHKRIKCVIIKKHLCDQTVQSQIYLKRYGLLSSDLWIDTGFHCGEGLEVLVDDKWVRTRMEMNPAREWYLVGTSYCGDLEYVQARIPE